MDKVEGLIAFYKLQQWWFSSFTPEERTYIDDCYQPMGTLAHRLTQGIILERKEPAPEFLNELSTWFRSNNDSTIAERIHQKLIELAKQEPIVEPGYYEGRHYTTYIRDFKILKKSGKYAELESLLAELVRATEEESAANGMGVAPAYYNELAILYRKQKEYSKEIAILERFAKQRHAGGVLPTRLLERLRKAQQREAAQTKTSG